MCVYTVCVICVCACVGRSTYVCVYCVCACTCVCVCPQGGEGADMVAFDLDNHTIVANPQLCAEYDTCPWNLGTMESQSPLRGNAGGADVV